MPLTTIAAGVPCIVLTAASAALSGGGTPSPSAARSATPVPATVSCTSRLMPLESAAIATSETGTPPESTSSVGEPLESEMSWTVGSELGFP